MCLSLNYFCCCFSLSAGAKIVSVVSTLCSAASVVLYGTPAALQYSSLPPGRLIFYSCVASVGLLQTIFGCMLIHGTFRKKPRYLWPWLVLSWSVCAALVVLSVTGTVLLRYNKNVEDNAEISTIIALYFLTSIILFYFVSVVSSRRHQMVQDDYKYLSKRLVKRATSYYY
ncbi:uncharacterized protein LOC115446168 [Manduca sexta]|uniref:uncharacterized protein LOC115446168 n=1 Tax=Manduca sexta TaxID=7130 RepID=UPI00188DCBBE|nr:uncharacterized protein LOC115446168 [Manduca sexta]